MFYRSFVQVWASPESRWFKIAKTGHWKKDLISIFWYLAFRKLSLLLWWIEAFFVNIHQRKINLKLKTNEMERTIKSCEEKYIALFKKKKKERNFTCISGEIIRCKKMFFVKNILSLWSLQNSKHVKILSYLQYIRKQRAVHSYRHVRMYCTVKKVYIEIIKFDICM